MSGKGILPSDPCIVDSMVLRGLFLLWDVFMAAKRDGPKRLQHDSKL